MQNWLSCGCLLIALQDSRPVQDRPTSAPAQSRESQPASRLRLEPQVLRWPEHKNLVVATIGGQPVELQTVLEHVQSHHAPGLLDHFATPEGLRDLNSPLLPLWVRLYCDMRILREEAQARGLKIEQAEPKVEEALRLGFEGWKQQYSRRRERDGKPVTWTPEREAMFLPRFRREEGIKAEIKVWLDLLVPDEFKTSELQAYHARHGDVFGGEVLVSHLLIRHRDLATGRLFAPEVQEQIQSRLRDIRSRLRPDGANFQALVQMFSEDTATIRLGGDLGWVTRLDQRFPALLVREAWRLHDGEWVGPLEGPEGWHFIRRSNFHQNQYIIFYGDEIQRVRAHVRAVRQEELIFELRDKRQVILRI